MVFSSPIFLFVFLPVVLLGILLPSLRLRNLWLLAFSVVFYAWGEVWFVFLLLASTWVNYFFGRRLEGERDERRRQKIAGWAIAWNIGLLALFKYYNFAVENINGLLAAVGAPVLPSGGVRLPLGISFFTFHAISYIVDVCRRVRGPARHRSDLALYIFFFPQLIAGPILRWSAIAPQIDERQQSNALFADGIRRFVQGLAKKVLIANVVAVPADKIFQMCSNGGDLTAGLAWLGAVCYTLQIYFDFSGYSDMAIGMGKMFGFQFMENFNYPYISQSIREFWHRWHISLSSWFRDYVYIPLGGNRCSAARNRFNLFIVFVLCGLWHGASWAFVVWGLFHGFFIVLEHGGFGRLLERTFRPLRHLYAMLVVIIGWVLFRAPTFIDGVAFLGNMFGITNGKTAATAADLHPGHQTMGALILGIGLSLPLAPGLNKRFESWLCIFPRRAIAETIYRFAVTVALLALFVVSAAWLAGATYNPFIYFRF